MKRFVPLLTLFCALGLLPAWAQTPEPIELPIADGLGVSYFVQMSGSAAVSLTSYDQMSAYEVLQERTGIDLNFVHPTPGGEQERFNLMVASGDLPDVIEWNWLQYPGGPERALRDGVIIPLNDLIARYAPNLQRILDENPEVRRQVTTADGTVYAFPFLRLAPEVLVFYGPMIRRDWLDALGLEMPQTIDDWTAALRAFKEGDPNGNGEADETPLSVEDLRDLYTFLSAYTMTFSQNPPGFYRVGDEVRFAPLEPAYRDFLEVMRTWYAEGLLDPAFPSVDDDELEERMGNGLIGATSAFVGGGLGKFTQLAEGQVPGFRLVAAPFPQDASGDSYNTWYEANKLFNGYGAAISSQAENLPEIVKFLDYGYSEEGALTLNFGQEGVSYEMVDGQPVYTEAVLEHPSLAVGEAINLHARPQALPSVQDPRYQRQLLELEVQREAIEVWGQASRDLLLPPIAPSAEDVSTFNSIMADAGTYVEEMTVNFILGRTPLEEFESYQATLQGMGVEEAVAIMQSALDSYNARE